MTTTTAPRFRYIGTTDDLTECEQCGRVDLRCTVVLEVLDADGNGEGVTYYGSSCAARALGVRGGGAAVRQAAQYAGEQTKRNAADARAMLAHYGLPEAGEVSDDTLAAAVARYITAHATARWAADKSAADWRAMVLDMIARKRAALAEAALIERTTR